MTNFFPRTSLWALAVLATFNMVAQNNTVVREAKAEFSDIKTIKVDGQFCKIEVAPTDGSQVIFEGKLISDKQDDAYQLLHETAEGVLTIHIKYPAQGWTTHSGEVFLKVPQSVALEIVTTSGTVKASGLTDTELKVVSRSGALDMSACQGNITLESITGTIKSSDCSGNVKAKSKSGPQFFTKVQGNLMAGSTEGEITITGSKGAIQSESTSGSQTISFHEGNINAKSVNGSIKMSETKGDIAVVTFAGPLKLFKTTGIVNLQSTTGEQVGTRVMLTGNSLFKTSEGKIKMQIDNKTEDLTFALKSTTSFIQARGTSKKKSLKLGKGPIVVSGESTTGGQVYN